MFYKLLVEHSRNYNTYTVENGCLQFVEPTRDGDIIGLDASFNREELDRFAQLLQKIWHCITTVHLPDTSGYDQTYAGIVQFEQDLLNEE